MFLCYGWQVARTPCLCGVATGRFNGPETPVGGGIAVPHAVGYIMNYLFLGNMYRRSLETPERQMQYIRDTRITGNPYKVASLETIPDEQEVDGEDVKSK
ncbi:uncharacterized protein LOC132703252 [Cylas formicarius]|uniref:uncharacterized protein LOC132703252 n=1 Tax=Cylas formicarius TaxID=197179 RepID=UPI002958D2B8|nr:uncharacterized protein LOC132703252 [Cylas formicarius]